MIITAAMVAAVAIAIYLADCIVLIDRGQAICSIRRLGVVLDAGTTQFTVARRAVVWLNPLTPWRLAVKAAAPWEPIQMSAAFGLGRKMKPLQILAAVQALLVFVLAPLFLHYSRYVELVMVVAGAFIAVLVGALWLWRIRETVNMSIGQVLNSAVTSLICLPLSINVARKAAIAAKPRFSALSWLRKVRTEVRTDVEIQYKAQLEEAMLEAEDGGSRQTQIREALARLTREGQRVGA